MPHPNFCGQCGSLLGPSRSDDPGHWSEESDCLNCELTWHTTYGDAIGGSRDDTISYPIKKNDG